MTQYSHGAHNGSTLNVEVFKKAQEELKRRIKENILNNFTVSENKKLDKRHVVFVDFEDDLITKD